MKARHLRGAVLFVTLGASLLLGGCAGDPWPELEAGQDNLQAAFPPPEGWVSEQGRTRVGASCPYECPAVQEIYAPPEGEQVEGKRFEDLCAELRAALEDSERFRWTGQENEGSDSFGCHLTIRERTQDNGPAYTVIVDSEATVFGYVVS